MKKIALVGTGGVMWKKPKKLKESPERHCQQAGSESKFREEKQKVMPKNKEGVS